MSHDTTTMCSNRRKIALVCDNAPTHIIPDYDVCEEHELKVINLSNIKIVFLPPNVTSYVQPLDQGIIAAFKAHYRRYVVRWLIQEADNACNANKTISDLKPTFYEMMQWCHQAWTEDVTQTTIRNCWRHSCITPDTWYVPEAELEQELDPVQQLQGEIVALSQHENSMIAEGDEFIGADTFVELSGEAQTEEELSDEQILQMVSVVPCSAQESDSDIDAPVMNITYNEAMVHAERLREFTLHYADDFGINVSHQLEQFCRKLGNMRLTKSKQTQVTSFFHMK